MMNKTKIFIFLLCNMLIINIPANANEKANEKITIEECYQMARENYPLLKQYNLINLSESYNLRMASHAYIPQFAINGKATYQNEVLKFPFEIPEAFGTIPDFSKDQYQVALEMTQIVWDGGITSSKRKSTKAQAQSSREEFEVDMYALKGRVNNIYLGILLIQEQIDLNNILIEQLKDNADRVKKCIENGVANSSDLDMIDVEIISANQRKVEMQTMQKAYCEMLSIMIAKKLEPSSLIKPNPGQKTPSQLLAEVEMANIKRPELKLFDAKKNELKVQEDMLYTYVMPRLGLFVKGMYGRPGFNMMSDDFAWNAVGGLTLSWNFGGLYNLLSGKRLLETNTKKIDVMRDTFLFNTKLQTRSQMAESEKYIKLMKEDDKIISLRERIRKSVESAMENGAKNASDLIQELTKEQIARQQKVIHEIELIKSIYELKNIKNN